MIEYRDFRAPTDAGATALANEWLQQQPPASRVVNVETLRTAEVRVWMTRPAAPQEATLMARPLAAHAARRNWRDFGLQVQSVTQDVAALAASLPAHSSSPSDSKTSSPTLTVSSALAEGAAAMASTKDWSWGSWFVTMVELEFHHVTADPEAPTDPQRWGPFPSDALKIPNDSRSGFLVWLHDGSPAHARWCSDAKEFKRMGDDKVLDREVVRAWAALPFPVAEA